MKKYFFENIKTHIKIKRNGKFKDYSRLKIFTNYFNAGNQTTQTLHLKLLTEE